MLARVFIFVDPCTKREAGYAREAVLWSCQRGASSVETGQMSSVETRQMSQQQSSVLSQQCPRLLLAAIGGHGPKSSQEPLSFYVFELATPYSIREGRRSVSPSIDFYNNFLTSSSAITPPAPSLGLLKIGQNPQCKHCLGNLQ